MATRTDSRNEREDVIKFIITSIKIFGELPHCEFMEVLKQKFPDVSCWRLERHHLDACTRMYIQEEFD
jgi:hypothetical protein|tara:strand:+ start:192 stop:395 length:204 start_codon:yes stop_codon:yes gene_type:complete